MAICLLFNFLYYNPALGAPSPLPGSVKKRESTWVAIGALPSQKLGSLLLQKLNGNSFLDYFPPNPQVHTLSIYTAAKRTLYYFEDCSCIYLHFIQYIIVAGSIVTIYNICYIWAYAWWFCTVVQMEQSVANKAVTTWPNCGLWDFTSNPKSPP